MTRPVLLITDPAPEMMGGGTVILHSLIGDQLGHGIVWASPSRAASELDRGLFALTQGSLGQRGRRSAFRDSVQYAGALADEAIALAEKIDAGAFWIVLHGAAVHVAAMIARRSTLPMHVTVHDDPAYANALRSKRYFLTIPLILRDFGNAMRRAKSVDVIGEGMRERYQRLYGVRGHIVHRALSQPISPSPPLHETGLTVGMLGSTYGYPQLPVLAEALILAGRQLQTSVKLVICGQGYAEKLKAMFAGRLDVEATGHLSEAAGIERLRGCTMLYLNYPFGWRNRVLRETSFPTKLSTYIYSARPIIIHAPPGTSVAGLPADDGYITPWMTMDASDGGRIFAEVHRQAITGREYDRPAEAIRARYYDAATHRATMTQLLRQLTRP